MQASDMTSGIEIEATVPAGSLAIGGHGCGVAIPGLPGWKADRDPSIHAAPGRSACEFVSPVYRGAEGLRQLVADVKRIGEMGARVNASCGLHVHVGFDLNDAPAVERLASLTSNVERAIYASTGTKSRERGRWCRSLARYGSASAAIGVARQDRYHVCNLASHHPTVEFRAFGASLNPQKVVAYVRLCVGLVERAATAKRVPSWTATAAAVNNPTRGREGAAAVTRLFYVLGWTRGRQPYTFGNLDPDGVAGIGRSKKELMRLARKYDAQP